MTPHALEFTMTDAIPILCVSILAGVLCSYLPEGYRFMRKTLLPILLLFALTVPLTAQVNYLTLADITVSGTAANVFSSSDILAGNGHPAAQTATCALTAANIRWTVDGTDPTTNLGTIQVIGNWTWVGTNVLLNLKAIRDDSTSAVLSCTLTRQ